MKFYGALEPWHFCSGEPHVLGRSPGALNPFVTLNIQACSVWTPYWEQN